ncbi:hypothetical protein [Streptosporangium carneum]|uniref:DUF4261 domain-containing protein n=1 Tax=Streptosporangium carneum TaxID=47481 RepID=A0A9W6IC37_9ACTN|nr:hypothetical protein [Streptosporangium carneum]GLK14969.1 hypothetical protein GCM10017600_83820 [Streptosporangium carneum]
MFEQNYDVLPRHALCALGSGLDLRTVEEVVARAGGPGFVVDRDAFLSVHDPRMSRAFAACLTDGSFAESDEEAVRRHDSVVYVLSPPMPQHLGFNPRRHVMIGEEHGYKLPGGAWSEVLDISRRTLAVAGALLRSGATAVKTESSGLTHGRDRWLFLADRAAEATDWMELAVVLFDAWVKRPISSANLLRSCGMHLLGAPDVELEADWPDPRRPSGRQIGDAVELMDNLALYLLTEDRALMIFDGEGFRLSADGPRWVLRRHPCDDDEESFFYNPYGYWRLTPDGSPAPVPAGPPALPGA